jgi:carboxyl-terminal processing protease
LRLEDFMGEASDEVHDALRKLRSQRARQVILDLRGNPGGSVIAAVEIASEFFPKGTIIFRTQGRKRDVDTTFLTKRDGGFRDLPLIVLINEGSASASEALAGSLQDHDRALIVGRRSFGKALMQTLFFLPHGDNVYLTVGRVLTPNGRFIQRRYRGLARAQYLSFAGKSGAEDDTATVYRSDAGRALRGGGGIVPDVTVPALAAPPVWFAAAVDSGWFNAIADSVGHTLDAAAPALAAWIGAPDRWRGLVPPFLARVRAGLRITASPDSAVEHYLARRLAARAAEVRWGEDALDEFLVRTDITVRAGLSHFPRLDALLAAPAR